MIAFASLQSDIVFDILNVDIGSEIEYPITRISGLPTLRLVDVFKLVQSVGRRRKPGDRFDYHNCLHTDSDGFVIENAPAGFYVYYDKFGAINAIGYRGFYLYLPDKASDHTFQYGPGVYRVTVQPCRRTFKDREILVTSVRTGYCEDKKHWSGNLYAVARDGDDWYLTAGISNFTNVVVMPKLPKFDDYVDLDSDTWVPRYPFGESRIATTDDSNRLEEYIEDISNFARHVIAPDFELEDGDIFYKILDRITPDTTNWGEFYEGVVNAPEDIADLARGTRDVTRSRRAAAATVSQLAGLYLFYLYAVKPTPDDLRIAREVEGILRNYSIRSRPRLSTRQAFAREEWGGWQSCTVELSNSVVDAFSQVDEFLDSIPSGELRVGSIAIPLARERQNEMLMSLSAAGIPTDRYHATRFLLDNVSLSFAADWLFGFNEKLDELHAGVTWRRIPVESVCRAIKAYRNRTEELRKFLRTIQVNASCSLLTRAYRRVYTDGIPDLPLSSHNPDLARVWDQAGALILARLR